MQPGQPVLTTGTFWPAQLLLLSTEPFPSAAPAHGTEDAPVSTGWGTSAALPAHLTNRGCPQDAGMGLPAARHLLPAPSRRTRSQ